MNWPTTIAVLVLAPLLAFLESIIFFPRQLLGAQIDLLPSLMVYVSLKADLASISMLALVAGFSFDSLSLNPLGTTTLPLLAVGLLVFMNRQVILREQLYAQFLLGFGASAAVPFMSVLILLVLGESPLLGWGSFWQWFIMAVGGGALAPGGFFLLDKVYHALSYASIGESTFRSDREIKRGR